MNTRIGLLRLAVALCMTAMSVGCTSQKTDGDKKVEAAEAQLATVKQETKVKEAAAEVAAKKKLEAAEAEVTAAREAAKIAAQDLEDFGYERRAEYLARVKRELNDSEIELNQLARSGAAKADSEGRILTVRGRWTTAKEKLDAAGLASEATWSDAKKAIKQSRNDLKDAMATTRQWLSDQIEP